MSTFWKNHRFNILSWIVTIALVASLVGGSLLWKNARAAEAAFQAAPTAGPEEAAPAVTLPLPPMSGAIPSVGRQIQLVTNIPAEKPRYEAVMYMVERGDAMSKIAEKFNVTAESILYNNKDVLNDDPHGLKPGMVLTIPPVDGLFYTWKEGDTIDAVAAKYKADPEDIINFPGNDVDLTNPDFKPGTMVMIPGGSRELINWAALVPTYTRGSGTATSEVGGTTCGGGAVGDGVFGWPVGNEPHTISGNIFSPSHLGVDLTANQGDPIYAADDGVVTFAGWSEYGYGNMVQIDHGNGYVSLYAHLSQYNVTVCESVGQGTVIGLAGATGNAFGAHLHFEIRISGTNVNPMDFIQ